jgi:hypothetical protein
VRNVAPDREGENGYTDQPSRGVEESTQAECCAGRRIQLHGEGPDQRQTSLAHFDENVSNRILATEEILAD